MISLGHLSDLHATPVRFDAPRELLNKRFLGWLSWTVKRSKIHRTAVLDALVDDLHVTTPDQVVITGDLTNLACEHEFLGARDWLQRIGGADRVSVVPGNHDAYVRMPRAASWDHWSEFMHSDSGGRDGAEFPTLRVRGPLALVGVSSATPTPPFFASGRVGAAQLKRLEKVLAGLVDSPLCRVLLIHHPPTHAELEARRALRDAEALRAVLRRTGVDLVLHGHCHRTRIDSIEGPGGAIPSIGVRSSSDVGRRPEKRAQYHLYEIERTAHRPGARFRVTLRVRGYDPDSGRFAAEDEQVL